MATENINNTNYTDDNIKTLDGVEHIRLRPGMYIGTLGKGDDPELTEKIMESVDANGLEDAVKWHTDDALHTREKVRDFISRYIDLKCQVTEFLITFDSLSGWSQDEFVVQIVDNAIVMERRCHKISYLVLYL